MFNLCHDACPLSPTLPELFFVKYLYIASGFRMCSDYTVTIIIVSKVKPYSLRESGKGKVSSLITAKNSMSHNSGVPCMQMRKATWTIYKYAPNSQFPTVTQKTHSKLVSNMLSLPYLKTIMLLPQKCIHFRVGYLARYQTLCLC